jgi:glycosyltransferase involved in cell wall biosynthesis
MSVATRCINSNRRKCDIKVITLDHNQGQSAARNAGIAAATGDYIYFLDSDDYLPPFTISRLMQEAQGCDADFITGNYIVTGGNRKPPRLNLPTGIVSGNTAIIDALYREQKFTVFFPAGEVQSDLPKDFSSERVLVQGVIDCIFLENGKLVLVDYKTDRTKDEDALKERYKKQLAVYKRAAEEMFGLPVETAILYAFSMKKEVRVNI